ncbi:MAG: hypothetical protein ACJA0N_000578 [Pseudohongiellaceae bacterium]|jgi:hypothetical protein
MPHRYTNEQRSAQIHGKHSQPGSIAARLKRNCRTCTYPESVFPNDNTSLNNDRKNPHQRLLDILGNKAMLEHQLNKRSPSEIPFVNSRYGLVPNFSSMAVPTFEPRETRGYPLNYSETGDGAFGSFHPY